MEANQGIEPEIGNPMNQQRLQQQLSEASIRQLEQKLDSTQDQCNLMAEEIRRQRALLQQNEKEKLALTKKVEEEVAQKVAKESMYTEAIRKFNISQETLKNVKQQMEDLSQAATEKDHLFQQCKADLVQVQKELLLTKINSDQETSSLNHQLALSQQQVSSLTSEKEFLSAQVSELNEKLLQQLQKLSQKEIDAKNLEIQTEAVRKMNANQLEFYKKRSATLESEIKDLNQTLSHERDIFIQTNFKMSQMDSGKITLNMKINEQEKEISHLEQQLLTLRSDFKAKNEELKLIAKERDTLNKDKVLLSERLKKSEDKFKALSLAKTTEDLDVILDQQYIEDGRREIMSIIELQSEYPKQIQQLQESITVHVNNLREVKQLNKVYQDELSKMAQQIKESQKNQEAIRKENQRQSERIKNLSKMLQETEGQYFKIKASHNQLLGVIEETKSVERITEYLNGDTGDAKYENLEALMTKIAELDRKSLNLKQELEVTKAQLELSESKNVELVKQLEVEMNQMKDDEPHQIKAVDSEKFGFTQYLEKLDERFNMQLAQLQNFFKHNRESDTSFKPSKSSEFDPSSFIDKESLSIATKEIESKAREVSSLQLKIIEKDTQIRSLTSSLEIERQLKQNFERQSEKLQQQVTEEKKINSDLNFQIKDMVANSNNSFTEQFSALQKCIKDYQDQIHSMSATLREEEIAKINLSIQVQNVRLMNENLNKEVQKAKAHSQQYLQLIEKQKNQLQNVQENGREMKPNSSNQDHINELKQMLVEENVQKKQELEEKDALISQLQTYLEQQQIAHNQEKDQLLQRLQALSETSTKEITEMTARLQELEQSNTMLSQERVNHLEQIEAFNSEKFKLQVTGEMQSSELSRLQSTMSEKKPAGGDINQKSMQDFERRISEIMLALSEVEQQKTLLEKDLKVSQDTFAAEKKILQEELDSLREKEEIMKRQNEILSHEIDQLKRLRITVPQLGEDRLNSQGSHAFEDDNSSLILQLKEQVLKAEQATQQMRNEWLEKNEQCKKDRSECNRLTFENQNLRETVTSLASQKTFLDFQLKETCSQLEINKDLEAQIKNLKELNSSLNEKILKMSLAPPQQQQRNEVSVDEEILNKLRHELSEYKNSYREASDMIIKLRGNGPKPEAQSATQVIKTLHLTLLKGIKIFQIVQDMIEKMPETLLCKRAHPDRQL